MCRLKCDISVDTSVRRLLEMYLFMTVLLSHSKRILRVISAFTVHNTMLSQ